MQIDTWRDPNADSGLRLDHWLNESDTRWIEMSRIDGRWHVALIDGHNVAARTENAHLDEAWVQALDRLARKVA
jgi:hypothetical protein